MKVDDIKHTLDPRVIMLTPHMLDLTRFGHGVWIWGWLDMMMNRFIIPGILRVPKGWLKLHTMPIDS